MRVIVDYFVSTPEAIATLLVFLIGSLASVFALTYALLARYPIVVRYLGNRGLVRIDPALRATVSASFQRGETRTEIHELRQVDYEIYNSHPRNRIEKCSITICLPAPGVHVLGVTAANSDHRTPLLGGRLVTSTIQHFAVVPNDPLFAQTSSPEYPAVVIRIPYLERLPDDDRVLIRITYDGPRVESQIRGAKLESKSTYAAEQRRTVELVCLALLGLAVLLHKATILMILFLLAALILLILLGFRDDWILRWSRPFRSPLAKLPLDYDTLSDLHYYDSLEGGDSVATAQSTSPTHI